MAAQDFVHVTVRLPLDLGEGGARAGSETVSHVLRGLPLLLGLPAPIRIGHSCMRLVADRLARSVGVQDRSRRGFDVGDGKRASKKGHHALERRHAGCLIVRPRAFELGQEIVVVALPQSAKVCDQVSGLPVAAHPRPAAAGFDEGPILEDGVDRLREAIVRQGRQEAGIARQHGFQVERIRCGRRVNGLNAVVESDVVLLDVHRPVGPSSRPRRAPPRPVVQRIDDHAPGAVRISRVERTIGPTERPEHEGRTAPRSPVELSDPLVSPRDARARYAPSRSLGAILQQGMHRLQALLVGIHRHCEPLVQMSVPRYR